MHAAGTQYIELWRKGTTQIIKSYDVRFIEDPRFITRRCGL